MTRTLCDICGKEMPTEIFVGNIEDLNFCISSHGRSWDICDDCRESLNRWLAERGGFLKESEGKT